MRAARLKFIVYVSCLLSCQMMGILGRPAHAQMDWGDRSFDTSSSSDWDRRWDGGGWLGSSGASKDWQLGVTGDNTNTGVVVRQVVPNSPASRAGINIGDVIVCVDGDQVGRVGNQIYDVGEEVKHHADSSGRVLILWQDRTNRQLKSLPIQLNDQRGGLTGTLVIRNGRLPNDAVVTVQLENVTRPHFVVRNGQYSFRLSNSNLGQIPFELNYDPRYISQSDAYRLRAYITSNGRTIYDTPQPQNVLTNGYPNSVQLLLRPASYVAGSGGANDGFVSVGYTPVDAYTQQINAIYQRYLGRRPTSIEMAAWYQTPDIEYRVRRLPLDLMAAQEFFDRTGNNNYVWVQRVFAEIIGRTASPAELDLWMRRFAELRYSRTELVNQLNMQAGR